MTNFYHGNMADDRKTNRNWLVGSFITEKNMRHDADVEVKYNEHLVKETRDWSSDKRKTIMLVLYGRFIKNQL